MTHPQFSEEGCGFSGENMKKFPPKSDMRWRLLEGSIRNPETGCLEWQRGRNHFGYAVVGYKGSNRQGHRVSYEVFVGEIPEGKMVLHSCDVPYCLNPKHLRIGTHADNMMDKTIRGRNAIVNGSKHGLSKLKELEVLEIVEKHSRGVIKAELAREYGVTHASICQILWGMTWAHITGIPKKEK